LQQRGQHRFLHGVLARVELPVPAHERTEHLRRQLAQQGVPAGGGDGHVRPLRRTTISGRTSTGIHPMMALGDYGGYDLRLVMFRRDR